MGTGDAGHPNGGSPLLIDASVPPGVLNASDNPQSCKCNLPGTTPKSPLQLWAALSLLGFALARRRAA
jgi:MYXO-CTERM domain-containing protein